MTFRTPSRFSKKCATAAVNDWIDANSARSVTLWSRDVASVFNGEPWSRKSRTVEVRLSLSQRLVTGRLLGHAIVLPRGFIFPRAPDRQALAYCLPSRQYAVDVAKPIPYAWLLANKRVHAATPAHLKRLQTIRVDWRSHCRQLVTMSAMRDARRAGSCCMEVDIS